MINWKSKKLYAAAGAMAAIAIAGCIYAMSVILNHMLLEDARADGVAWAENVAQQKHTIDRLVEGDINFLHTKRIMQELRDVGNVYSVQFVAANGEILFEANQFRPSFAAHDIGNVDPDIRTRFVETLKGPHKHVDGTYHHNLVHTLNVDLASHIVRLGVGDGRLDPLHYAEVNHPILKDGVLQYALRIRVDQTERFDLFHIAIWEISLLLSVTAIFVVGVPAYLSAKSRKVADLADQRAHYLTAHDPLTGLDNRKRLIQKLENACSNTERAEKLLLATIDVDGFREINDEAGHEVGDQLLTLFASTLKNTCGNSLSIARIGGDEYACVTPFTDRGKLQDFLEELQSALSISFQADGQKQLATASVGAAVYPTDAKNVPDLIKKAETALKVAKSAGGNKTAVFDQEMERGIAERRALESLIRHATKHHTFDVHFQPLICGAQMEVCSFEALVRLRDAAGQIVSPEKFIPIAEDMGIMEEFGAAILHKAARAAVHWPNHIRLAVNLSAVQFESGNIVKTVERVLKTTSLPANRLELEITESLLMQDTDGILSQLIGLKALGVSIAMDDFGTGYSSLGYLWKFPFDKIKIDRSFLRDEEVCCEETKQVISTIIALAHTLDMHVTAEGVESECHVAMLRQLNCDQMQGFYFGRPTPSYDLSKFWSPNNYIDRRLIAV